MKKKRTIFCCLVYYFGLEILYWLENSSFQKFEILRKYKKLFIAYLVFPLPSATQIIGIAGNK